MICSFFPVKKLRRNGKYLFWGAILVVGAVAMYYEFVGVNIWSAPRTAVGEDVIWRRSDQAAEADNQLDSLENSALWRSIHTPLPWKPEYKGQANLHIFEDWCGSSTAQLRNNLHYPLYPHTRTTVEKLAVSPQWTNYGLRIFGYLHPFADGEYVFAVSSDDNSEFWLSKDDSLNVQLLAWVGKTGTEWTAPGEYDKYASQTSRSVILSAQKRYFFEVIYKQNDRGTDHIEVAWQLNKEGWTFMVIESKHLSLYTNESTLLMSDVDHIPQTVASHADAHSKQPNVNADMLREDPRDSLHRVPLISSRHLQRVLPDCAYKPTYLIKGFPLLRYQGLQFVHMSYIYPNDYTRLTHMERENSCFYRESPIYLERYGFARYMELDRPEREEREDSFRDFQFRKKERMKRNNAADYGDDYDDYALRRRRKIFSVGAEDVGTTTDARLQLARRRRTGGSVALSRPAAEADVAHREQTANPGTALKESRGESGPVTTATPAKPEGEIKTRSAKRKRLKAVRKNVKPKNGNPPAPVQREQPRAESKERTGLKETQGGTSPHPLVDSELPGVQRLKQPVARNPVVPKKPIMGQQRRRAARPVAARGSLGNSSTTLHADVKVPSLMLNQRGAVSMTTLMEREIEVNMPLQQNINNTFHRARVTTRAKMDRLWRGLRPEDIHLDEQQLVNKDFDNGMNEKEDSLWVQGDSEDGNEEVTYDNTPPPPVDPEVNWRQTFRVNQLDMQAMRSDWIDLRCNVSGNLMLQASDALSVVKVFMDKLNQRHHGQFTLVRVINVEKHLDSTQGSRYLLELEVKNAQDQVLRLSHYIYALIRQKRQNSRDFPFQRTAPQVVLCNPVVFRWNPTATVHFIVPVKNQARWVRQLIVDMEALYRETGDPNFNLIITDYNSTDIDVEKALQTSTIFRYQYTKLSGNFERSAGLQAGINLIDDQHSIVFLCDLHIHFPLSIIDTIRKHCIEGRMAFAPIVMRLDCGATPTDPRGYWEVNGFGLLGIYKSDLEAAGGMNTREFRDSWGGEDWELLDRILQSGLEVERIYLRNFFHHYHSKRGMWNRRIIPNPR